MILFIDLSLFAQELYKVTIPGTAFFIGDRSVPAKFTDRADGRYFQGKASGIIKLNATLNLPPQIAANPGMQRLVLHFRANFGDPSLHAVKILNGSATLIQIDKDLTGNYTAAEVKSYNVWEWPGSVKIPSGSVISLEVSVPGGFEGGFSHGVFVLNSVEIGYAAKFVKLGKVASAAPPLAALAAAPPPVLSEASKGVIYGIDDSNNLVWYRHTGWTDGSFRWATDKGRTVGTGWNTPYVFPGDNGVIYTINNNGDLSWYRHTGCETGSFLWAAGSGNTVGRGWHFKQVFSGGNGVIYAITYAGELLWYRHLGYTDGSFRWATPQGSKVGTGWNFEHVFSGGDGVIYAVTSTGDLLWYRHLGYYDGSLRWATPSGSRVGTGWNVNQVFSAGDGLIYAVGSNGDLLWHRHDGFRDGTVRWAFDHGKKVGTGWSLKQMFAH